MKQSFRILQYIQSLKERYCRLALDKKALVDLDKEAFKKLKSSIEKWQIEDLYICPGPIQFFGNSNLTDLSPQIIKYKSL